MRKKNYVTDRQAKNDNAILRMRFAYWIIKATNTYLEYIIFFFPTATMVRRICLIFVIQCDQKVSVHLVNTIQPSGAQRLFDHTVHT